MASLPSYVSDRSKLRPQSLVMIVAGALAMGVRVIQTPFASSIFHQWSSVYKIHEARRLSDSTAHGYM